MVFGKEFSVFKEKPGVLVSFYSQLGKTRVTWNENVNRIASIRLVYGNVCGAFS